MGLFVFGGEFHRETRRNYRFGTLGSPLTNRHFIRQRDAKSFTTIGERRMSKTIVVFMVTTVMLATVSVTEAQQPRKVPRIGYLAPNDRTSDSARSEPIRRALRDLGYIDGQNIAIEYRYAEGKVDRFSELAAELVRLKVDVIVAAGGGRLIQAAKNATKTIPIVMSGAGVDPVEAGFVESLARPGGNVTGITNLNRELGGKRLEVFKEAVPKLARVAVLFEPALPSPVHEVKEVLPVAVGALKLTIQPWEIRAADDFDRVFAALNKQRPDGLYVAGAGPLVRSAQRAGAGGQGDQMIEENEAAMLGLNS
jgi:putative ABC transport system substrate-binding protein